MYINFLYDNTENSVKGKKYALNEFYTNMNVIYNKFNELSEEGINLLYKFLLCEYITNYEKKNLITYYNALIDRRKYDIIDLEFGQSQEDYLDSKEFNSSTIIQKYIDSGKFN